MPLGRLDTAELCGLIFIEGKSYARRHDSEVDVRKSQETSNTFRRGVDDTVRGDAPMIRRSIELPYSDTRFHFKCRNSTSQFRCVDSSDRESLLAFRAFDPTSHAVLRLFFEAKTNETVCNPKHVPPLFIHALQLTSTIFCRFTLTPNNKLNAKSRVVYGTTE